MNTSLIILLFLTITLYLVTSNIQLSLLRLFSGTRSLGKFVVYAIWLIYFPGILLHELSHLITAVALFLKVKSMQLLPVLNSDNNGNHDIKFGSVTYIKADPIRGLLVGIAPFFFGSIALTLLFNYIKFPDQSNMISNIMFIYLSFVVSSTMFSSKQDLRDLMYVIPTIIVIFLVFYFIQFNPFSYISISLSIQNSGVELISMINKMFSISLMINLVIYAIVRIIKR